MQITAEQLAMVCQSSPRPTLAKYAPRLTRACAEFGIDTPKRVAAFIAQIAHESGGLRYVREIASGAAYDTGRLAKRLGNTLEADGDGQRFKGRGLIQITGRANYEACSRALFPADPLLLLSRPEFLEQPTQACRSAAWYWWSRQLNRYADSGDFVGLTRRINGGLNGLEDRVRYWRRALSAFHVQETTPTGGAGDD